VKARAQIIGDTVRLSFPYCAALIARIKAAGTSACRSFDPRTKVWTVREPFLMAAIAMVYDVYPDVVIDDPARAKASGKSKASGKRSAHLDPDYSALRLLPSAPDPLVDAAYKCLARLHHPDVGGDTTRMQQLNAAREAIRARRAS
jgi:hypothetical protein